METIGTTQGGSLDTVLAALGTSVNVSQEKLSGPGLVSTEDAATLHARWMQAINLAAGAQLPVSSALNTGLAESKLSLCSESENLPSVAPAQQAVAAQANGAATTLLTAAAVKGLSSNAIFKTRTGMPSIYGVQGKTSVQESVNKTADDLAEKTGAVKKANKQGTVSSASQTESSSLAEISVSSVPVAPIATDTPVVANLEVTPQSVEEVALDAQTLRNASGQGADAVSINSAPMSPEAAKTLDFSAAQRKEALPQTASMKLADLAPAGTSGEAPSPDRSENSTQSSAQGDDSFSALPTLSGAGTADKSLMDASASLSTISTEHSPLQAQNGDSAASVSSPDAAISTADMPVMRISEKANTATDVRIAQSAAAGAERQIAHSSIVADGAVTEYARVPVETHDTVNLQRPSANNAEDSTAQDTFSALDASAAAPHVSWTQAGTQRAEAGYADPDLGWVSVRADLHGGSVHATVIASSSDSATTLGAELAGLNAHLAAQQIPVEPVTMAATSGQSMNLSDAMQQGSSQNSRDDNRQSDASAEVSPLPNIASGGAAIHDATLRSDLLASQFIETGTHISVMV